MIFLIRLCTLTELIASAFYRNLSEQEMMTLGKVDMVNKTEYPEILEVWEASVRASACIAARARSCPRRSTLS